MATNISKAARRPVCSRFKYKARKRDGAVVYGTVNAPNEAAVAAFIRKQDMYVAGIEASKKKGLFSGVLFEESINLYDISIFARQFATLQEPVCRF